MLQNLHVKNLALIDEVEVDFAEGLNILTGETGAGNQTGKALVHRRVYSAVCLFVGNAVPSELSDARIYTRARLPDGLFRLSCSTVVRLCSPSMLVLNRTFLQLRTSPQLRLTTTTA